MKIVNRNVNLENMGNTLTVQHIGEYLGENKARLGTLATLWPDNTLTALTDTLANVFYGENKSRKGFNPVDKYIIEWDIDVNEIPKVYFVGDPVTATQPGADGDIMTVFTDRKYYDPNDTIGLENGQLLFVVSPSERITNEKWAVQTKLVADDSAKIVDVSQLGRGKYSIWKSNHYGELSERGYTKYTSDSQVHRNFMSLHRNSISWSMDYARSEDKYIDTGKKTKKGDQHIWLKLKKKELMTYQNFMLARENNLLDGQSNFDIHGKCLIQDEDNQDVPMGDGAIRQLERYAGITSYADFSTDTFDRIMSTLTSKSDTLTGNSYGFIVNQRLYESFQKAIKNDERIKYSSNNMLYSVKANEDIKVGGNFVTYEYAGNKLVFMPNKGLSSEKRFWNKGYGIAFNLIPDRTNGHPAIANYTMDGGELITGSLIGMGGKDGKSSGDIYSSITGSEYHLAGYSTSVVANPYDGHIIEESVLNF